MALPFDRSIRALRSEREGTALAVLASAAILLALWTIWFFFAPIPRYETGQVIGMNRNGALIAIFPTGARLQPGQPAQVRPDDVAEDGSSPLPVPAMVMLVERNQSNNQLVVELAALSNDWFGPRDVEGNAPPLLVDVEVEKLSPAQLVLHASGQWIDGPSVRLRPQSR